MRASDSLPDRALSRLQDACEEPEFVGSRYTLGSELGRGGMGVVYEVHDAELDRFVALKVVPGWESADAAALDRVRQEARTLAALEHPGIVPVHDLGTLADGRVYYTMKLVRGEPLGSRRADGEPRSIPEVLRLVARLCETMEFAHAHGVIHRDLKPDNIMLGPFGEIVVLDWGIARLASEPASDGERIGTRAFMAPEQLDAANGGIDARTDVFALGGVLRSLLGKPDRAVPGPVRSIVARATAPDPALRYVSAAELGADLLRFLDGEPVGAHRESWTERAGRLARRHQLLITLILTYLVMRSVIFFTLSR